MRKKLLAALVLVGICVGVAMALAPARGMIAASSGTSSITRTFQFPIRTLIVAPATQDVVVLLVPSHAQDDSFTIRANDVRQFSGAYEGIFGFVVLRPVATAVDIHWE